MARSKGKSTFPNAVHLTVVSVPRAARFYVEKLGFKQAGAWPDADKPVFAKMVLDGQVVMLGELPSLVEARQMGLDAAELEVVKQDARALARGTPGVGVSVYLQVADVDRFAVRMKKRRVRLLLPPKTQFYGARECAVADTDGYRLVFYSPVIAAPPSADG
ncbi:MAG: VOC family protein [Planctomycetes bacterium]|nr:VOC family protein [Planctomycetota bacterium]